jgi:hypothetical protein
MYLMIILMSMMSCVGVLISALNQKGDVLYPDYVYISKWPRRHTQKDRALTVHMIDVQWCDITYVEDNTSYMEYMSMDNKVSKVLGYMPQTAVTVLLGTEVNLMTIKQAIEADIQNHGKAPMYAEEHEAHQDTKLLVLGAEGIERLFGYVLRTLENRVFGAKEAKQIEASCGMTVPVSALYNRTLNV